MISSYDWGSAFDGLTSGFTWGSPIATAKFDKDTFGDDKEWTLNFKVQGLGLGSLALLGSACTLSTSLVPSLALAGLGIYIIRPALSWHQSSTVADASRIVQNTADKAKNAIDKIWHSF